MNRHNLPLTSHAANECEGWLKIVLQFKLSHKPMGLASINNFTFNEAGYTEVPDKAPSTCSCCSYVGAMNCGSRSIMTIPKPQPLRICDHLLMLLDGRNSSSQTKYKYR